MLDDKQLDRLTDGCVLIKKLQQVELDIIEDMGRRIKNKGHLGGTAADQAKRLAEVKALRKSVQVKIKKAIRDSAGSLNQSLVDGAKEALKYDDMIYAQANLNTIPLSENLELQGLITGMANQTQLVFENLTQTTAIGASGQLGSILDRVYLQVNSGAFTYKQAIDAAIRELGKAGITAVTYTNGRRDTLYVASRRALLTSINQTANKVNDAYAEQMGADLVEVSAHVGARPDHASWQGKVYSRSGKSTKYPSLDVTGYGSVSGLAGANCRHTKFAYFEGQSKRAYTDAEINEMNNTTVQYRGKTLNQSEALQVQRTYERNVRNWKQREAAAKGAGLDTSKERAKIKLWQANLRNFTRETGLKRDYSREQ